MGIDTQLGTRHPPGIRRVATTLMGIDTRSLVPVSTGGPLRWQLPLWELILNQRIGHVPVTKWQLPLWVLMLNLLRSKIS